MRSHLLAAGCTALLASTVRAQDPAAQPPTPAPQGTPPPAAPLSSGPPVTPPPEVERPKWTFGLSAYQYFLEDGGDYLQTTLTADRGELHVEARHNYEGLDTTSAWLGWNTSPIDGDVALQLTPMIGYAFGDTEGPALGYRGAVSWKKLELYSEGEYVFDSGDQSGDFFYNWSELTLAPTDWFRFGVVAQRTRTYESNLDIQRGLLVGFHFERLDLSTQVFNLDQDHPTYVVSASFGL